MIKILPFVIVALLIVGALAYFRFFVVKQNLTDSSAGSVQSSPIEVPKTLPGATLEDRVKSLEDTVKSLVQKVNASPAPATSADSRLADAEAAITELKARVSSLENSSGTSQTSTSSKSTVYIPLGSGGQINSDNYSSLNTFQVSLDPAQYPGYKNMQLEVNMRLNQPGATLYARLYDNNTGSAVSGEISTTSTSSTVISSSSFTLPSGSNTYVLQSRTSDGSQAFLDYARIKVNF